MKKFFPLILVIVMLSAPVMASAFSFRSVSYVITTDILEILDRDYHLQFEYVLSSHTSFTIRLGNYRTLEDSNLIYANGARNWEIGSRYRWFILDTAPHLLFIGMGFDNRPQDNSVTPTGELGVQICLKPFTASLVGFSGYQWHYRSASGNRWVKGIELRAGVCF